jgi:DNA polymerase-3 subunit epsilon
MTLFDSPFGRAPETAAQIQTQPAKPESRAPKNATAPNRPAFPHASEVPNGDFRFIALDVETACSDVASICQIGLACVEHDNRIQTYSMLVNPGTRFDAFNIRLDGIGPATLSGAPRFADALDAPLPLLNRHNIFNTAISTNKRSRQHAAFSASKHPPFAGVTPLWMSATWLFLESGENSLAASSEH